MKAKNADLEKLCSQKLNHQHSRKFIALFSTISGVTFNECIWGEWTLIENYLKVVGFEYQIGYFFLKDKSGKGRPKFSTGHTNVCESLLRVSKA